MDGYTPTTEEVRTGWIVGETRDGLGVDHDDLVPEVAAEFDRWLAKVKADAWDEGWNNRAGYDATPDADEPESCNPYRQEATR